jgi:hypothetical protein
MWTTGWRRLWAAQTAYVAIGAEVIAIEFHSFWRAALGAGLAAATVILWPTPNLAAAEPRIELPVMDGPATDWWTEGPGPGEA